MQARGPALVFIDLKQFKYKVKEQVYIELFRFQGVSNAKILCNNDHPHIRRQSNCTPKSPGVFTIAFIFLSCGTL